MSVKEYRFFGQVQEVNDIGETTDAGWSVFCTWVKQEDYARLQAEVERLTKAGDIMLLALWLGVDEYSKEQKEKAEQAWNEAKEGKQS